MTISLVCVFGWSAVRTNNVATTNGGGRCLMSFAMAMDATDGHVIAKLHQDVCWILLTLYLLMLSQHGPFRRHFRRKFSKRLVLVPKMCSIVLYTFFGSGAGYLPSYNTC